MFRELKAWPEYYDETEIGNKTFEERVDDRGYEVGDVLLLRRFDPVNQKYTGKKMLKKVTYALREPYAREGHVIMAIKDIEGLEIPKPWVWGNEVNGLDDNPYEVPTCPTCGEATYSMPNCPFCGQALKDEIELK